MSQASEAKLNLRNKERRRLETLESGRGDIEYLVGIRNLYTELIADLNYLEAFMYMEDLDWLQDRVRELAEKYKLNG